MMEKKHPSNWSNLGVLPNHPPTSWMPTTTWPQSFEAPKQLQDTVNLLLILAFSYSETDNVFHNHVWYPCASTPLYWPGDMYCVTLLPPSGIVLHANHLRYIASSANWFGSFTLTYFLHLILSNWPHTTCASHWMTLPAHCPTQTPHHTLYTIRWQRTATHHISCVPPCHPTRPPCYTTQRWWLTTWHHITHALSNRIPSPNDAMVTACDMPCCLHTTQYNMTPTRPTTHLHHFPTPQTPAAHHIPACQPTRPQWPTGRPHCDPTAQICHPPQHHLHATQCDPLAIWYDGDGPQHGAILHIAHVDMTPMAHDTPYHPHATVPPNATPLLYDTTVMAHYMVLCFPCTIQCDPLTIRNGRNSAISPAHYLMWPRYQTLRW